jgi:hypothetical protein
MSGVDEDGMVVATVLENGTEDFVTVVFNGTTNSVSHKDRHRSRRNSLRCRTNKCSRCRTNSRIRLLRFSRPLRAQWLRHRHHSLGRGCSISKWEVFSNSRCKGKGLQY